jgi:hypothetical protein
MLIKIDRSKTVNLENFGQGLRQTQKPNAYPYEQITLEEITYGCKTSDTRPTAAVKLGIEWLETLWELQNQFPECWRQEKTFVPFDGTTITDGIGDVIIVLWYENGRWKKRMLMYGHSI